MTNTDLAEPLDLTQPGLPAIDTVHQAIQFTPVAGGPSYRILRTTEFDGYDSWSPQSAAAAVARLLQQTQPLTSEAILAAINAAPAAPSDNFAGTARATAKLSIGQGRVEPFGDVRQLVGTLAADNSMVNHQPPITTDSSSIRVAEEQRNVHVTGFLYASSREADNDFHLIVGLGPSQPAEMYMTMEVSGLPPAGSASLPSLKGARDSFQIFFGVHLPLLAYDFYHPPIPVVIDGSLFFDMSHANGQHPGPPSLKSRMPTIWEVHPVTAITLGAH